MTANQTLESILKTLDSFYDSTAVTIREMNERMKAIEQSGFAAPPLETRSRKTAGMEFAAQIAEHSDLLQKTGRLRLNIETKAATDPIGTSVGRNVVVGDVGAPQGQVLGLQYGLPRRPAGATTALEYSRYTGIEGGAAQQAAEGDTKAYVRPTHSLVTQSALTVAGLTKLSKQAMSDRAALARAVDVTLRRSVDLALDVLLVSGGTGFVGGYEALATVHTSAVYTTLPDAVSEAVAAMQGAGFKPNVVAVRPSDWLATTVAKGSDGHYLSGAYLGPLPSELRGLRVVLSTDVTAGKALLMDTAHSELLDVEGFAVEAALSDTDFEKNLMTLRGEIRVIPTFLTTGAARLVTPAP